MFLFLILAPKNQPNRAQTDYEMTGNGDQPDGNTAPTSSTTQTNGQLPEAIICRGVTPKQKNDLLFSGTGKCGWA